ncbi:MAG: MBL fold metallo-hydrolase [Bacillota bacterium]
MLIEKIKVGVYQTNTYIVAKDKGKEAIIIDPAGDFERIKSIIKKYNLDLKYILLTHGHGDHIGAIKKLKEKYDLEIYIHKDDEYMLKNSKYNLTYKFGEEIEIAPDKTFKHGDNLKVGQLDIEFIHTPGHTKGSSCIKINSYLFSGDTLFYNSIGRTDLEGGDKDKILKSIKEKLLVLPSDIKVYPGHGAQTTINNERLKNPFFR